SSDRARVDRRRGAVGLDRDGQVRHPADVVERTEADLSGVEGGVRRGEQGAIQAVNPDGHLTGVGTVHQPYLMELLVGDRRWRPDRAAHWSSMRSRSALSTLKMPLWA